MRKLQPLFLSCLTLYFVICQRATALKCYSCMKCNDPFKKDGVETVECSGVCVKVKTLSDVGQVKNGDVTRSCLPAKTEIGCKTGESGGIKGEVCVCDTDYCNGRIEDKKEPAGSGGSAIRLSVATGMFFIIAAILCKF